MNFFVAIVMCSIVLLVASAPSRECPRNMTGFRCEGPENFFPDCDSIISDYRLCHCPFHTECENQGFGDRCHHHCIGPGGEPRPDDNNADMSLYAGHLPQDDVF